MSRVWLEYLKWISVGMIPMLLFGMYRLYDKRMVITKQANLISSFRKNMHEIQRSADQYVASIEKYCELKAIDDSWFYSLNSREKHQMYQLRDFLGMDDIPDVNMATAIVRQVSEQVLKIMSKQLTELEDALRKEDIEEMRQLQDVISKIEFSYFLKRQMEHVKSEIISSSRAIQRRGALYQLFSVFYDFLVSVVSKLAVPLATKLFEIMIL